MNDPAQQYERQCDAMLRNGKRWLAEHPGAGVQVQFNFPETVFLVATISDAIERHYVSTNAEGLELVHALWPQGQHDEPTVAMVRMVLESLLERQGSSPSKWVW